jgi:selenocysteine-specific elongation factor
VLDPEPPARGLRRAQALARFAALAEQAPAGGAPLVFLTDSGARGVAAADLVRRAGLGAADAARALGAWAASGQALVHGDRAFDSEAVRAAESAILAALASDHRARPEAAGLARETLRARAARTAAPAWFDWILERLAARGATTGTDTIALHGHRPVIEAGGSEVRAAILETLAKAGLSPPDAAGLATAIGQDAAAIDRATHVLLKERRLVRAGDVVFHADVLARLKEDVRQMASAARAVGRQAQLDVATFKSSYGLTRKYAIPLLEWLDRERVTRRVGDNRVVL